MGLLDLAGKAIGGAVNFTASVAKKKRMMPQWRIKSHKKQVPL